MFNIEREFEVENDHAVLPPSPTSPRWEEEEDEEEEFLFTSWVKDHWQIGMRITSTMPFFFLFVVSLTAVTFWPVAACLLIIWIGSSLGWQVYK